MYGSFEEFFTEAENRDIPLWQVVLENEAAASGKTKEQVLEELENRWDVMSAAAVRALYESQKQKNAFGQEKLHIKQPAQSKLRSVTGEALEHMIAMTLYAGEANVSAGQSGPAPTVGSPGVLPAVLLSVIEGLHVSNEQIMEALLVAGGVAAVIARKAAEADAEGGCRAECGAAAAMAAAAVVTLADGSPRMVGEAVSIAFVNCMGLVCDSVENQSSCQDRKASQAINAVISADMAMAGQTATAPPDELVEAVYKTGSNLPPKRKETAAGGVVDTSTATQYARKLQHNEEFYNGEKIKH